MIVYFSATGNSLWVARKIAGATGDRLVRVTTDTDVPTVVLDEGERLGFVFPVHGWRPPIIVRQFIERLSISNAAGHYTYAVCTAGDNIGETLRILADDLNQKGIHLDTATSVIMPESYIGLPFMDVDTTERERQKISDADNALTHITDDIVARRPIGRTPDIGRWPRINSRVIGSFFLNHLVTDKHFHVDAEKCLRCGICASVCPVGDIKGGKGETPQWLHNGHCLTCFNCYHHCPTHAIDFGKRTQHKGQYFFGHAKWHD